jgi:hypothetical protein
MRAGIGSPSYILGMLTAVITVLSGIRMLRADVGIFVGYKLAIPLVAARNNLHILFWDCLAVACALAIIASI